MHRCTSVLLVAFSFAGLRHGRHRSKTWSPQTHRCLSKISQELLSYVNVPTWGARLDKAARSNLSLLASCLAGRPHSSPLIFTQQRPFTGSHWCLSTSKPSVSLLPGSLKASYSCIFVPMPSFEFTPSGLQRRPSAHRPYRPVSQVTVGYPPTGPQAYYAC